MSNPAQDLRPEPPRWLRALPVISLGATMVICVVAALLVFKHARSTVDAAQEHKHWTEGYDAGVQKAGYDHRYFELPPEANLRSYADLCCPPLTGEDRREWTDGFVAGYVEVYKRVGGPPRHTQKSER